MEGWKRLIVPILAISGWFLFNFITLALNKVLYDSYKFRFPITLTFTHMVSQYVLSIVCGTAGLFRITPLSFKEQVKSISVVSYDAVLLEYDNSLCRFVISVNVVLGNACLQHIPISFVQVVKVSIEVLRFHYD